MGETKRNRTSRAQARAREIERARQIVVPARCDVAVVGGGAAGLAAAIVAAEAGAETVVLEAAPSAGRTILATGNGRCNFCAAALSPDRYNDPAFVAPTLGEAATEEVLAFFLASGLAWCQEEDRLYPLSRQAASVRTVLLARAERAGVRIAPGRAATDLVPGGDGWEIRFAGDAGEGVLGTRSVVLAGGGRQAHGLAPRLPRTPLRPILCPLAATGLPFAELDGRRAHGTATLVRDGGMVAQEAGEFLFRPFGVSGIAAFNLSRDARPGDTLLLDLAPERSASQLARLLRNAGCADGVADPAIGSYVWSAAEGVPERAAALLKRLSCTVEGVADEGRAQVTRGGIAASAVDPATLEADPALAGGPRLFACGEALDVDGPCGGYNLGWAWLSGIRAGSMAASRR